MATMGLRSPNMIPEVCVDRTILVASDIIFKAANWGVLLYETLATGKSVVLI